MQNTQLAMIRGESELRDIRLIETALLSGLAISLALILTCATLLLLG